MSLGPASGVGAFADDVVELAKERRHVEGEPFAARHGRDRSVGHADEVAVSGRVIELQDLEGPELWGSAHCLSESRRGASLLCGSIESTLPMVQKDYHATAAATSIGAKRARLSAELKR
jgi:hypothetical protein